MKRFGFGGDRAFQWIRRQDILALCVHKLLQFDTC